MQEYFISLENKVFLLNYEYKAEENIINMKFAYTHNNISYKHSKLQLPTYLKDRVKYEVKETDDWYTYDIKISESKNYSDDVRDVIQTFKNYIVDNHIATIKENEMKQDQSNYDICCGSMIGTFIMFVIMMIVIRLFYTKT